MKAVILLMDNDDVELANILLGDWKKNKPEQQIVSSYVFA